MFIHLGILMSNAYREEDSTEGVSLEEWKEVSRGGGRLYRPEKSFETCIRTERRHKLVSIVFFRLFHSKTTILNEKVELSCTSKKKIEDGANNKNNNNKLMWRIIRRKEDKHSTNEDTLEKHSHRPRSSLCSINTNEFPW